jgi:HD-like signal output (HDOD) protein
MNANSTDPHHSSAELGRRVQRLTGLPPLSLASERLTQLLASEQVDVDELASTVEMDPGLAARIVGFASSPFFTNAGTVHSVQDAIHRVLGLDTVKSLALSIIVGEPFQSRDGVGFDLGRYWTTAMMTALTSRKLTAHVAVVGRPSADDGHLCGLLHNVGLLAMSHLFPDQMTRVFRRVSTSPHQRLHEVEQAVLGTDHHQIGGWLARRWHLPEKVIAVIEHHHNPAYRGPHWATVLLVGLASRWTQENLETKPPPPGLEGSGVARALGIPQAQLDELASTFEDERASMATLSQTLTTTDHRT